MRYDTVEQLVCERCDYKWQAETYHDRSVNYWEIKEEHAFCPRCQHEYGERVEDRGLEDAFLQNRNRLGD